jgi:hypothetical protein
MWRRSCTWVVLLTTQAALCAACFVMLCWAGLCCVWDNPTLHLKLLLAEALCACTLAGDLPLYQGQVMRPGPVLTAQGM